MRFTCGTAARGPSRLRLLGVRRVLDDRDASGQADRPSADRRAKAAAREHGHKRARRLTPFDFRIALLAGHRRWGELPGRGAPSAA
jgi:hypothetical protein